MPVDDRRGGPDAPVKVTRMWTYGELVAGDDASALMRSIEVWVDEQRAMGFGDTQLRRDPDGNIHVELSRG